MFMIHLNTDNFDKEVLKSETPVMVDFWAEWCGPCKMFAPLLDEIDSEFGSKIKVCKLDVDSSPEISAKYSVFSIPTLIFFKNGAPFEKLVGMQSKKTVVDKIGQIAP